VNPRKNLLIIVYLLISIFTSTASLAQESVQIYVSPHGDDAWDGHSAQPNPSALTGPLKTLKQAGKSITDLSVEQRSSVESVTINLLEGRHYLGEPLFITADNTVPFLRIKPYREDDVRLIGGKAISNFELVTDENTSNRLDASAKGKVYRADLKALGINNFGTPKNRGLELFFNDKPMQISRWPNEGFTKISETVGGELVDVRGTKGDKIGRWKYDGTRPERWVDETQGWLYGYWFWDWSSEHQKIKSIEPVAGTIEVESPYHNYGYRNGQWYYALNILSEIDTPGEWYLDAAKGELYFWPPAPLTDSNALVSVLQNGVELNGVSNVIIEGITFEGFRNTIIRVSGGHDNLVTGCTFRNSGGNAVSISDGTFNGVTDCDIYDVGAGGISLRGGNRPTLTPANHYAVNNHIHDYARLYRMYHPAISLQGVGQKAAHNLIDNAPHMAIQFGGNNHLIEFNEIHSVSYESNDAGAIYAGRDWTQRGTIIRHNYLHHINGFENKGCVGVYLDDMFSGTQLYGNVFYKVTRAAFIGGGRDNVFTNNLFVECPKALHIDARAMNWASYHVETTMTDRLKEMPYTSSLWKDSYPPLQNILGDEPAAPKGNRIEKNIFIGGTWNDVFKDAKAYVSLDKNFTNNVEIFLNGNPGSDADPIPIERFRLKPGSIPIGNGYDPLPLKEIGLYESDGRKIWPIQHSVRTNE
jgi:hypothetical protein